jgi:hypothetical protein
LYFASNCSGQQTSLVTLTSSVSGTTYAWSSIVTGIVSGNTPNGSGNIPAQTLNNGNTIGTVTYSVTPSANNCLGNPVNFVVTVNPTPILNPISSQTICSAQSTTAVTLATNVAGTTFNWSSGTYSFGNS